MSLGEKLKLLRTSKKMSQQDVASLLGIERSTYGKYETGDSSPDYSKLVTLANFFNVTTDYLLSVQKEKDHYVPETIAAHFDGDEYSDEDLRDIEKFLDYLKSKKK